MISNIKKVLHAGISVYNMDESVKWYKENLGFKILKEDGYVLPLKAKIVFLEKDGFQIELFEYEDPKKIPEERLMPNTDLQTVGTKHIAFETDNMASLKNDFIKNGVDIAHEVCMEGNSVMFIRDCNGVLIEFIENK